MLRLIDGPVLMNFGKEIDETLETLLARRDEVSGKGLGEKQIITFLKINQPLDFAARFTKTSTFVLQTYRQWNLISALTILCKAYRYRSTTRL